MTDKDECLELKNIKYQTMLLNNNSKTIYTKPNVTNIEHFLQKEKELNKDLYFSPGIFFYSYDILLFVIECDGIYEGLYDNEGEYRDKRPIEMLKMKNATLRDKYLFYNITKRLQCYFGSKIISIHFKVTPQITKIFMRNNFKSFYIKINFRIKTTRSIPRKKDMFFTNGTVKNII